MNNIHTICVYIKYIYITYIIYTYYIQLLCTHSMVHQMIHTVSPKRIIPPAVRSRPRPCFVFRQCMELLRSPALILGGTILVWSSREYDCLFHVPYVYIFLIACITHCTWEVGGRRGAQGRGQLLDIVLSTACGVYTMRSVHSTYTIQQTYVI